MYKMDAFYFSVVVIVSLLSLCRRCEAYILNKDADAYILNKDADEKLLILAIVFVVILVSMIVLVIVMCCALFRKKSKWWSKTNSLEYKNAASLKIKEAASPFYGASHSQGRKKESVYLPDYETVGPAYAVYENPGVNGRESRIEQAEEPSNHEHLDLGKKQPTSFINEAYEATTGTHTFQTPQEQTKEKESGGSNAVTIENQTTSGTYTIQTTSETNIEKAQATEKESSDPYMVLTTPSSTNYYEALSPTASSSNDEDTAL